ncbi:MAG: xanthine dehydrogenase family protein subunit M [Acidobacteria bacterium]|nr:xanthine dehydrogenase family protein subunit M [Acidobacteriota bacterium]
MPVIRDVMPAFELFQPTSIADTLGLLSRHDDAWIMAGGLDSFDWLKDRIKRPSVIIDLGGVGELRGIREAEGGVEIGANTTLTELSSHPVVREKFRLLAEAAGIVGSPQIRNQGSIGGNLGQDTRCHYYRAGWPCYRAGGNICYADTPTAVNREHAILEADRCVAVSPSDSAPALIALDAQMVVRNADGERIVAARDFFIGPWLDITRMTVLKQGDLLVSIRVPGTFAGKSHYFEKVRDRQVWDFPLVNIAAAMATSGNTIDDVRLVVGGVAARPIRLVAAEDAIRGRTRNEDTAQLAADIATRGAVTLRHNAYKVPLMQNLVKRAIRGEGAWTS